MAALTGVTARQRKNEVERLNEQLRKINTSLRKQARSGTIYAPGLTYVPPGVLCLPAVATRSSDDHGCLPKLALACAVFLVCVLCMLCCMRGTTACAPVIASYLWACSPRC